MLRPQPSFVRFRSALLAQAACCGLALGLLATPVLAAPQDTLSKKVKLNRASEQQPAPRPEPVAIAENPFQLKMVIPNPDAQMPMVTATIPQAPVAEEEQTASRAALADKLKKALVANNVPPVEEEQAQASVSSAGSSSSLFAFFPAVASSAESMDALAPAAGSDAASAPLIDTNSLNDALAQEEKKVPAAEAPVKKAEQAQKPAPQEAKMAAPAAVESAPALEAEAKAVSTPEPAMSAAPDQSASSEIILTEPKPAPKLPPAKNIVAKVTPAPAAPVAAAVEESVAPKPRLALMPSEAGQPVVLKPVLAESAPEQKGLTAESRAILNKIPFAQQAAAPRNNEDIAIDRAKSTKNLFKEDVSTTQPVTHESMGMKVEVRQQNLNVNYELEKAYGALASGQTEVAIRVYEMVLENDPSNTDALLGLATTYHRAGQIDKARPLYGRLLSIDPKNRDALNNFLVLLADEAPMEAISQLEVLEDKNPGLSMIPAQLAGIYQRNGAPDRAVEKMMRAIALSPENLTYRYNLAILFDKQRNFPEAAKLYKSLIDAHNRGEVIPGNMQAIQQRLTFILSNKTS